MDKKFDDIVKSENEKVFKELSALCGHRLIVPYVGAGLSAFKFPLWDKFINDRKSCLGNRANGMNNIDAAEAIEKELGRDVFYKDIKTTYGGCIKKDDANWNKIKEDAKKQAVSFIPKLFHSPIITTNFDQVLEIVHDNIPVATPKNFEKKSKQAKQKGKRLLYKIHGCVSDEDNDFVFTRTKYESVYNDSEFEKSLLDFFLGFHFLFLGCSLEIDEPIRLWARQEDRMVMKHYAILECKKNATEEEINARRKELESKHIYPILYKNGNHEFVKITLEKLLSEKNANSDSEETFSIAKKLLDDENKRMVNIVMKTSTNDMEAIEKDKENLANEANKIYGNIYRNNSLKYNKTKRK